LVDLVKVDRKMDTSATLLAWAAAVGVAGCGRCAVAA
jgi:hypothetical protein